MEVKTHYKIGLVQRGKKIKDLADALHMDYSKVSRILNGFAHEPICFGTDVRCILAKWDEAEIQRQKLECLSANRKDISSKEVIYE